MDIWHPISNYPLNVVRASTWGAPFAVFLWRHPRDGFKGSPSRAKLVNGLKSYKIEGRGTFPREGRWDCTKPARWRCPDDYTCQQYDGGEDPDGGLTGPWGSLSAKVSLIIEGPKGRKRRRGSEAVTPIFKDKNRIHKRLMCALGYDRTHK
jgi:hypothetical protein